MKMMASRDILAAFKKRGKSTPILSWLLVDDNATCHRSRAVNLFKSEAGIRTISWLARPPDLNPIENVWSLLKCNVRRSLQHHFDLNDLQSLLQRE